MVNRTKPFAPGLPSLPEKGPAARVLAILDSPHARRRRRSKIQAVSGPYPGGARGDPYIFGIFWGEKERRRIDEMASREDGREAVLPLRRVSLMCEASCDRVVGLTIQACAARRGL